MPYHFLAFVGVSFQTIPILNIHDFYCFLGHQSHGQGPTMSGKKYEVFSNCMILKKFAWTLLIQLGQLH